MPRTESNDEPNPGQAAPLDAVVLSGTHQNPKRLIDGRNKAFLDIEGRPLVRHVVDALGASTLIKRTYVVGPQAELEQALSGCGQTVCVPQEGKMLDNAWAAIRAVEASYADAGTDAADRRPILLVSCDLPLVSAAGIDDFVARAAALEPAQGDPNAMVVGVCDENGLTPFHGSTEHPGIQRPMVQLAEGRMRLANIYVVRPRLLAHSEFLQTSFSYRKAQDWRNVMKLVISLFRQQGGWTAAWMIGRLQLAAMLAAGDGGVYRRVRAGNTMDRVEAAVSAVLGGPVKVAVTPFGGLSLDVDDEDDYRVLSRRYAEWMDITRATATGPARTR
ncbi:NTP transferase domain-containing protein [Marinihelvus fidelis]|uniref:NTP transferase domain-containing protein n=1 Tax=Marinihelvus fidelis TaxID=2613842 RepID=A0A5N0T874_9GAMM|nr:NTP transferase domain-containing protein [Marinihelvus fidelis]KAA9130918.1 NTP transferase domain-containing protein [Marinihelvus fidelis]